MSLHEVHERVERTGRQSSLGRRDEPQVPRRRRHGRVARDPAHDRQPHRGLDLGGMARRADPVQDHAHHGGPGVVGRHPVHDRTDRPGGPGAVHDQQHRGAGRRRHVGRRGEPVATDPAVVQAHDPLHDRDVRAARPVQQQGHDPVLPDQVRVQVAPRASGGERVVAGVDVVGTDLVPGDDEATASQRRHQPGRDGRLALPRRRRSHHEPGQAARGSRGPGHHSIPR